MKTQCLSQLDHLLSDRDWQILISVRGFRFLTTRQIARQHFNHGPGLGPIPRNANQALARLRELGLLANLERDRHRCSKRTSPPSNFSLRPRNGSTGSLGGLTREDPSSPHLRIRRTAGCPVCGSADLGSERATKSSRLGVDSLALATPTRDQGTPRCPRLAP